MKNKHNKIFYILSACVVSFYLVFSFLSFAQAGERRVTDTSGKVWSLEDWQDGTRPYLKDLKQRESAYQQKWGESWQGARYNSEGGDGKYIMSPGLWTWEEFTIIPNGKSEWFGQSQALVYAPNGSEQVTAVYALTKYGIYHVDPVTKELTFAGSHTTGGLVDGIGEQARMEPTTTQFGEWAATDPVTGRVYFAQKLADGNLVMRYVEKRLPYEESGTVYYLPAFLDYQNMYQQFKGPKGGNLIPVMQSGKRGAPQLYVGTTPVKFGALPGLQLWGTRVLLSPDGRSAYVEMSPTWPRTINNIHAIDLQTGQDLGPIKKPLSIPDGAAGDQHNAISSLYDGYINIVRHTGSGGGPGKLFRFNTAVGNFEILYDSTAIWPKGSESDAKNPAGYYELKQQLDSTNRGPADATTLWFATTVFQFQSPRTGAIMNGGWDNTGIPMYHDGFVTSLAQTPQNPSPGGRPEWQGQYVANFGSLQTAPDVAPNGDIYLTDRGDEVMFTDSLRQNGIRVIKLHRTDWPVSQPVNGYANQFLSPTARENLMKQYAQQYIAGLNGQSTPTGWPYPKSQVIDGITWDSPSTIVRKAQGSDNWPTTWGPDNNIYISWGDGGGFGGSDAGLGVASLSGSPNNFTGTNLWSTPRGYSGGKSYGIISINGVLYMLAGPGSDWQGSTETWLMWSNDLGRTWQNSEIFFRYTDGFSMPAFLNFGKDYAGARDNYVYVYSYDASGGPNGPYTKINLARVLKTNIKNRASYEFFSGLDANSNPTWTSSAANRQPVFTDSAHGVLMPSVSYDPGIGRYLLTVTHASGSPGGWIVNTGGLGIFDAPNPWGPWTTVEYTNNWLGSQTMFFANIPTKQPDWLSSDGKTFHLVFTGFGGGVDQDAYQHIRGVFNVLIQDSTPPSVPTGLVAAVQSESQINLSWTASSDPESGISRYNIYRNNTLIGNLNSTTFNDTGLSEGTSYSYQVSAVNGAGLESAKSSLISVATLADTTKPTIISISSSGDATKVTVVFSEPVEQTSATSISNYSISSGISISSVSLGVDFKTVTLTTSAHQENIAYILIVNNVKDRAKTSNIIAANTQKIYSYISKLVISNLVVASGKTYQVIDDGLQTAAATYIDRSYTFVSVPSSLQGKTYIKTANDDKLSQGDSFFSFDVNQDVTIYIAHDNRYQLKPTWLTSFTDSGQDLSFGDTFSIFKKDFPKGRITLGGNVNPSEVEDNNMYIVIIIGKGGTAPSDTNPPQAPSGVSVQ